MFLRRCMSTTSSLLARKPPPTVTKRSQYQQGFLCIHRRAFTLAQNSTSETGEEYQPDGAPRLLIHRVFNRSEKVIYPDKLINLSFNEPTADRKDLIEDTVSSPEPDSDWTHYQKEPRNGNSDIEDSDVESHHRLVAWSPHSPSEKRDCQEPQGLYGNEEDDLSIVRTFISLPPWVSPTTQPWHPSEKVQDSTDNADWAHLSPSRPLYSSLPERFQLSLSTQQVWRLQEIANHYKTRSVMTTEFGEKSEFSCDWMRPLEVLQHEAQLDGSIPNVPYDQATFTYYFDEQSSEVPSSATEIEVPTEWTIFSFAAFVTQVTQIRPLSWDQRRNRRRRPLPVEVLDAGLLSLFNDPSMRNYLTIDAFNSALAFFNAHEYHSIHRVRELYSHMETLQMDTDPRTFVIMLGAAAKQNDLALMTYFLVVMVRKGVKPTRKVWLALLETIQAKVVRTHVIRLMEEQGLLEDVAIAGAIVSLTLPPELPNHLQSGQGLQTFFDLIDARYGVEWPLATTGNQMTTTGNQMTQALCRAGKFSEALEVWYHLQARRCLPDAYTMVMFLRSSKHLFDIGTSIEIARHFWRLYGLEPGALAHDLIFRHAWAMRSFNCCKVVWQHACMEQHFHSRIDSMLLSSLTHQARDEPELVLRSGHGPAAEEFFHASDAWFKGAGKIVLAADQDAFQCSTRDLAVSRGAEEPSQTCTYWEHPWKKDVALQCLQKKEESLAGKQFEDDFVDVLLAAYALDCIWHEQSYWEQPTEWKVKNAISIPIKDRKIVEETLDHSEELGVQERAQLENEAAVHNPSDNLPDSIKGQLGKIMGQDVSSKASKAAPTSIEPDKTIVAKVVHSPKHPGQSELQGPAERLSEEENPPNNATISNTFTLRHHYCLSSREIPVPSGRRNLPSEGEGEEKRSMIVRAVRSGPLQIHRFQSAAAAGNKKIRNPLAPATPRATTKIAQKLPNELSSAHASTSWSLKARQALAIYMKRKETLGADEIRRKYPLLRRCVSFHGKLFPWCRLKASLVSSRKVQPQHRSRTAIGPRWQRKFDARRRYLAASNPRIRFLGSLDSLRSGESPGFLPLREPTWTSSSFKEARARITVRELQAMDFGQLDDSNQPEPQSIASGQMILKDVGDNIHESNTSDHPRTYRERRHLRRRIFAKSMKTGLAKRLYPNTRHRGRRWSVQ